MFCLPPAANIVALETHYQGTGRSAAYIASGTIVSCVLLRFMRCFAFPTIINLKIFPTSVCAKAAWMPPVRLWYMNVPSV